MHLDHGSDPLAYKHYVKKKKCFIFFCILVLTLVLILSIMIGVNNIPIIDIIKTFLNMDVAKQTELIILKIRFPQALTAIFAGAGLAVVGAVMQSVLNNPLGSPFTLGISNAAAFGAAFSVMILGTGTMQSTASNPVTIISPYLTTGISFLFCIITSIIILLISRIKKGSPEAMVLAGVALGSLFTAGTMFLQYFADDTQLAAMVFWTFGDTARAGWKELLIIIFSVTTAFIFFTFLSWKYNAISSGNETAKSLGVNTEHVRIYTMLTGSLVTAIIISFLGIIGFVGLIAPHMVRRIIGGDHRYLIPATALCGGILLLSADLLSRTILLPHVLPVAIITSFLGAPLFIYLLIKGYN